MNIEELRIYCLSKPGVEEGMPFGDDVVVFKVMGKMFCLSNLTSELCAANLKCDPEYAQELREQYVQIKPGFHMSKKHWNTVELEEGLEKGLINSLIDHSYELVVSKLSKKDKLTLSKLEQ